jgi:hypothetical protein
MTVGTIDTGSQRRLKPACAGARSPKLTRMNLPQAAGDRHVASQS